MQNVLSRLAQFSESTLTFEQLGAFVRSIEVDKLEYRHLVPEATQPGNYARNILMLKPLECVLLHWPPGVESAVHYHKGFWGYVLVLEGTCDNVEYEHRGEELVETRTLRALPGGVIAEPDGTIHKITNPSTTDHLVTCHFYYPALESLDGLVLYELESGTIGVLNEKAETASFHEPREHFKEWKPGAFRFVGAQAVLRGQSHRIFPLLPKPAAEQIKRMLRSYYDEQARQYDFFDLCHPTRRNYTQRIDALVAKGLDEEPRIAQLLAIACGTGRRAVRIRELSRHDYHILCVDLSPEMCCQAQERNLTACPGDWLKVEVEDEAYDAATYLYAFGHIPTARERLLTLKKIHRKLRHGGLLFLDVFNREDPHEWGPRAVRSFEELELQRFGYQKGDVFYKKTEGEAVAFLHYFTQEEITDLLVDAGFALEQVVHVGYVHRSGEVLEDEKGSLFLRARKV